jgi:nucleoside-diphosphate-sugar epimerase
VAGGAGFLGSYVVRDLLGRGYRVRVADNLSAPASRNSWGVDVEFIQTDLRDRPAALVALEDVDVCIIAAARSGGIGFFNRLPGEILDDNVRILSATFEAARAHHIRRVVYISSSCVFDKSLDSVAKEDSIASVAPPPSGYPFSKLVGEYYCRAYAQQYMLPYTIVRPFNLYGPGEASGREPGDSHVIPDLTARALMRQTPLEIYGGGQQTRSFTHVKDVARGIALAMESSTAENEDFNLGCPSEITILELAKLLWELCDVGQPFAYCTLQAFPNDIQRRAVDITKAKTLLGWEPQINLRRGLREFVEWMRAQSVARHALRT